MYMIEEGGMACALCGKRARMLCESDQAKLCWDCDGVVHAANFLVAKHVRVLLCRLCHSPTPWKASGPSLTPTSSLCHPCLLNSPTTHSHSLPNNGYHSSSSGDVAEVEEEEEEEDADEEEGENQVVPWSSSEVVGLGTSANNSDTDGDIMSSNTASATFRSSSPFNLNHPHHHNIHHHHSDDEDEIGCCSSEGLANNMMMRRRSSGHSSSLEE